jgi:hypothetical protein
MMIRGIAMGISTHFAARLTGVGRMLGMLVIVSAVTIGTAQAQNAATAPSRASQSGIQSAITNTRDSLQRRIRAARLWSQQQQLRATKPDPR